MYLVREVDERLRGSRINNSNKDSLFEWTLGFSIKRLKDKSVQCQCPMTGTGSCPATPLLVRHNDTTLHTANLSSPLPL